MNNINDLKQGVTVGNEERVNMFGGNPNIRYPNSFTDRVEVDLTQMPAPEPEDVPGVEIRENLAKDILEGENSPFGKYKAEKTAEMMERMAEYEEEMALEDEDTESSYEEDHTASFLETEYEEDNEDEKGSEIIYTPDMNNDADKRVVDKVEEETKVIDKPVSITEEDNLNDTEINMSSTEVEVDISDEEEVQMMDPEDMLKHLKKLATEKIKPVSKQLDISSFTIVKKPKVYNNLVEQQQVKVAKWVLPNQGSIVLMKEYLGSELEALREFSEDPKSLAMLTRKFRSIYDHIVSPKPESFETWCKSTPFSDVDHYFFAVYISAFKGVNYLPADCASTTCRETFLTDNIEIMDMVEFTTDKAKEKFLNLYKSEDMYNGNGVYCTEIVPLSNKIAVAFREPSIYNIFEMASLDEPFKAKYSSSIDFIPYIDKIYAIDMENKTLTPISYKAYADNAIKTTKSKVQKYHKMLQTLTIDEFGAVKAYVRAIMENTAGVVYKFPEVTCTKCGKPIEKKYATAEELVFTRHQLGALVNTSLS